MAIKKVVAKTVNEVGFDIDNKSWNALNKFQKRIAQLKKQMKGLKGNIDLKASIRGSAKTEKLEANRTKHLQKQKNLKEDIAKQKAEQMMYEDKDIKANLAMMNAKAKQEQAAKDKATKQREALWRAESQAHQMNERFNQRKAKQAIAQQNRLDRVKQANKDINDFLDKQLESGKITTKYYQSQKQLTNSIYHNSLNTTKPLSVMRGQYAAIKRETRGIVAEHKTLFQQLTSGRALLTSGVVLGGFGAGRAVMQTGQSFENLQSTLLMTEGSMDKAGKKLEWLKSVSNELGIDVKDASEGFTRLNVAGMDKIAQTDIEALFKGFSKFSVATGATKFRQEKAISAFVQMIDKGKLMA